MTRVLVPHDISPQRPAAAASVLAFTGRSMGCEWRVQCVLSPGCEPLALQLGIQSQLNSIVHQMSSWEPDSLISQFNHAEAGTWLDLPHEFHYVLAAALHAAEQSLGACDPTAGELVDLWGFGASARYNQPDFTPPTVQQISGALQRRGWQRVELDWQSQRVYQPGGIQLDFSAIAKGFAVDEVARYLLSTGVEHFLVDIGGELRGAGVKPDGLPWWIELTFPPGAAESQPVMPVTRIALHGMSVATSGDYLRCYSAGSQRYSHCIDPRDGQPITNNVASVTVLHPECMWADAWSTALMVLGIEKGLALAEQLQLPAYFIRRDAGAYTEHLSRDLVAMLTTASAG